jgi:hypothetical protein
MSAMARFQSVSAFACAAPADHGLPGFTLARGVSPQLLCAPEQVVVGLMGAGAVVDDALLEGTTGAIDACNAAGSGSSVPS